MATYKCLADLQGKTLKFEDTVVFGNIEYIVQSNYLKEIHGDNSKIFRTLSISKYDFTTNAYGYGCFGGDWPECNLNDYSALTRCVIELYKIIGGKLEEKQWYKITTPGKTGISPEQVKMLITKYGGLIDTTFTYRSAAEVYVWAKNKMVTCLERGQVKVNAIEVSPTSEIITIKQEEKHETQFQRKKARIERGTRPEGNTVCGRRSKASIAVGHLGYRKVTGI